MTYLPLQSSLKKLAFKIISTKHTQEYLAENGIEAERISKVSEGASKCMTLLQIKR